jgi:hypothetical protein
MTTRTGAAGRAAARTVRALVAGGVLDRARDAAAIERLTALAAALDALEDRPETLRCPGCGEPVPVGAGTPALVRLSRELRAWWQAIRERKEAVAQGVSLDALFADLDDPGPGPGVSQPHP